MLTSSQLTRNTEMVDITSKLLLKVREMIRRKKRNLDRDSYKIL